MPDGVIGDATTQYHCVPDTAFATETECSSGMFKITSETNELQFCSYPSSVACAAKMDGEACMFGWGGHTFTGLCSDGKCLAECTESGGCENEQSQCLQGVCQTSR